MNDWSVLRRELDRVEGRVFDFGMYRGWTVERVSRVDPAYIYWCGLNVRMRPALANAVLKAMRRVRRELLDRRKRIAPPQPCPA
ncbi:unnamed protein product [Gemmataceae bacterium]|nr:unnamed protein product [Gemmataceae bacterium]VTT96347.1 unnamed protein product [Gemmataceae bacterium]